MPTITLTPHPASAPPADNRTVLILLSDGSSVQGYFGTDGRWVDCTGWPFLAHSTLHPVAWCEMPQAGPGGWGCAVMLDPRNKLVDPNLDYIERYPTFSLLDHITRQAEFSARTFGPGPRVEGVVDHIRKELVEVVESGGQLREWIDVIILGLDGAWRSGATPAEIIDALVAKQTKNEGRQWPDWRTVPAGQAIEHDRSAGRDEPKGGE